MNIVFTDGVARTVTYNVSAPLLGLLSVDLTNLGGPLAAASTLSMPSDNFLAANGIVIGGYNGTSFTNGRGAAIQSAGTTSTNSGFDLTLGYGAGSTGTYTLSGAGSLTAKQSEFVGWNGSGTFNHSAGTNTVAASANGSLDIGVLSGSTGTYNLSGTGALVVNTDEYVGDIGTGLFNQTGGTHTIDGFNLRLGYNVSGAGGTYTLSAGGLSVSGAEYVGFSAAGNFNQSGGTNSTGDLFIGYNAASTATYTLSGTGSLVNTGVAFVGFRGAGNFNQSGGTHSVANDLILGEFNGSTGTYTLSGGSATVGGSVFVSNANCVLTVSNTGVLTVGGTLNGFNNPAINLSGGTINAGGLNFNGAPSLLNWTAGTLNLTSNVTFDSAAAPTSTSAAFGSSFALGSNQILKITGNETLGGAGSFSLTLNNSATHYVTGSLTLNPAGSITQNPGSTLYAATFVQAGGTVNGTLQNQGNFIYQSGQFNGRLLNQGTVNTGPFFTAANGVENDATITVSSGQTLTANGQGLNNFGAFALAGGTLSGTTAVNESGAAMTAHGVVNAPFTNNGRLTVDGTLRFNAAVANNGLLQGSGNVLGSFSNNAGGTVAVAPAMELGIASAWTNNGLATMQGTGAILGGGTITNAGTLEGAGTITAPIVNSSGAIRASGGTLILAGAGITNPAGGQIQAATGNTVIFLPGLATNAGTIALSGGSFDNNSKPLSNAGSIVGSGTLRSGSLTNTGTISFADAPASVFGTVANNAGGKINITSNTTTFFNAVTNNAGGIVKVTSATARFLGPFTNAGTFTSDPADNFFSDMSVDITGALVGGTGDRFFLTRDLINRSTSPAAWNTRDAELHFSGSPSHTLSTPGLDRGNTFAGYDNNFAWGLLQLAAGESLTVADAHPTPGAALYVRDLLLDGGLAQLPLLSTASADVTIYYDATSAANAYLDGRRYALVGGGSLVAVPEPSAAAVLISTASFALLARRRKPPRGTHPRP